MNKGIKPEKRRRLDVRERAQTSQQTNKQTKK